MGNWYIYQQQEIATFVAARDGETKLGEKVQMASSPVLLEAIDSINAKYVLLGVSESIGVQLNGGFSGTETTWNYFVRTFLNTQANSFINAKDILVLGYYENTGERIEEQDNALAEVFKVIFDKGSIPIVIGGGHNNAYPLLKGLSLSQNQAVNVINIDPHADMRALEGRHSGNGFSYAREHKYLSKYALLGLHKAYNNQFIIDTLTDQQHYLPIWWESIFLKQEISWELGIDRAVDFVNAAPFGLELDMDAIEGALSSALTPVGITAQQANYALYQIAQQQSVAYLHLPEGIVQRSDGLEQKTMGKLLTYLVLSFIKGNAHQ